MCYCTPLWRFRLQREMYQHYCRLKGGQQAFGLYGNHGVRTRSCAVAERTRDASCLPVVSFNSTLPQAQSLLPAGLHVEQPCRYCFYSQAQKWVFRPAGATRCPDKLKFGTGSGPTVRSPCQISRSSGQKCGDTAPIPQKYQNFKFWPLSGATRLHYFLRNSQRLYTSIGSF